MARPGVLKTNRDRRVALAGDGCDGQRAEADPGGWRAGRHETGVAATRFLVEQRPERTLPAGAEGGHPQRSEQTLASVPGKVEQCVDLGDGHLLGSDGELRDLVSGRDLSLLEHPEVEARPVVGDEQGGNPRVVQTDPDSVAGDARLCHLEAAPPIR